MEHRHSSFAGCPVSRAPLLQVHLDASYGQHQVLKGVQLELHAGEVLGLVGTSGAGKSTLVLALLGLLPWRGGKVVGEVLLEGKDLLRMKEKEARCIRGSRIALIPQSPTTALNNAVSLRVHFEEAWRAHEHSGRGALEDRLTSLLPQVQLPSNAEFLRRKSTQISVGQAQRVMIALALLHRPALLIADEPTSALDPLTQAELLKLLKELNRSTKTAMLYISHDLISVIQLCHRLAVLDAGTIVETLDVNALEEQARDPTTIALLKALPVLPSLLLGSQPEIAMSR